MEMLVKKIVLLPDSRQEFLQEIGTANDKLRSLRGFLSAIVLSSRINPDVLYYFSMWMDLESTREFNAYIPHFLQCHKHLIASITEESLQVLLSITSEGDFRPVVDA